MRERVCVSMCEYGRDERVSMREIIRNGKENGKSATSESVGVCVSVRGDVCVCGDVCVWRCVRGDVCVSVCMEIRLSEKYICV